MEDPDREAKRRLYDDGNPTEDTGTSSTESQGPNNLRLRRFAESSEGDSGNFTVGPKGSHKDEDEEHKGKGYGRHSTRAAAPAHKRPKESPLSSDAIFNQSHAGLFNLCVVLLVAVNSRLIIENLMKYGLLIRAGFWINSSSVADWPLAATGLTLACFPLIALGIEKLKLHTAVSEKVVEVLHFLNITVCFFYPAYVIYRVQSGPLAGFFLIFCTLILLMKLISYAHVNADIRSLSAECDAPDPPVDAPLVRYPGNVTLRNMAYFICAPTLCYQLGYPRSHHIRKGWLLRQLVKLVVFTGLMLFIIEQYINPTIRNSQHPLKGHFLFSVERVLKLSIPTLYVWLCIFYCYFHLWLNIVAEVTMFGDREFYKDWWNAKTIEEYWRLWNMPVHRWMVRHVYFPCQRRGVNKPTAIFIVFALSAVFHEVLVGIPCHMLRLWAFLGMIGQIPLVILTNYLYEKFKQPMVGNILFWFFFCIVGQPTCVLLYYHDVIQASKYGGSVSS